MFDTHITLKQEPEEQAGVLNDVLTDTDESKIQLEWMKSVEEPSNITKDQYPSLRAAIACIEADGILRGKVNDSATKTGKIMKSNERPHTNTGEKRRPGRPKKKKEMSDTPPKVHVKRKRKGSENMFDTTVGYTKNDFVMAEEVMSDEESEDINDFGKDEDYNPENDDDYIPYALNVKKRKNLGVRQREM